MKTKILNLTIVTTILLSSCGTTEEQSKKNEDGHQHEHGDKAHQHTFTCPMHPEVSGKEGEKCSKCGMKLEHNDNVGKDNNTYFMMFSGNPAEIESGKEATLSFTPKIKGKEDEIVPLEVVHEKKLHLIIVSNDLAYFEHIHPEFQSDGSYQIKVLAKNNEFTNGRGHNETKFDNGGDYSMFADYQPSDGVHQMEKINLKVKGTPYKQVTFEKERLTYSSNGISVSLDAEGGWETNKQMHIKAVVKKGNTAVDANTFDNYLGAKSHMVILKTESFEYMHVHPEVENGSLDLHTTFESPGVYRGWLQFQFEGKLYTTDFVIMVKEGAENTAASEEHNSDGHKH